MSRLNSLAELRLRLIHVMTSEHENRRRWMTAQIFYHLAAVLEDSVAGLPMHTRHPAIVAPKCFWAKQLCSL
ncbi:DUF1569 domain-containing protein [Blastopirellula sp. J2-11]|uniref:DUF1569 domain-containing protein n=1 Tax=Blastopirellula sp. J2-11 TaxID=2943192 RepID=UPI0039676852